MRRKTLSKRTQIIGLLVASMRPTRDASEDRQHVRLVNHEYHRFNEADA